TDRKRTAASVERAACSGVYRVLAMVGPPKGQVTAMGSPWRVPCGGDVGLPAEHAGTDLVDVRFHRFGVRSAAAPQRLHGLAGGRSLGAADEFEKGPRVLDEFVAGCALEPVDKRGR